MPRPVHPTRIPTHPRRWQARRHYASRRRASAPPPAHTPPSRARRGPRAPRATRAASREPDWCGRPVAVVLLVSQRRRHQCWTQKHLTHVPDMPDMFLFSKGCPAAKGFGPAFNRVPGMPVPALAWWAICCCKRNSAQHCLVGHRGLAPRPGHRYPAPRPRPQMPGADARPQRPAQRPGPQRPGAEVAPPRVRRRGRWRQEPSNLSGSGPVRSSRFSALIASTSSPESSKSKMSMFSLMRAGVTDLGKTMSPRSMCQRSTT